MKNQYAQTLVKLGCKKSLSYEGINDKFVTFYSYKSKWPHAGAGKRLQF